MRIGGIQKLTLIDFPGTIATTVFTVGCSFRCSFCHNPELVLPEKFPAKNNLEAEFFQHLMKRQGKLEGVCITGGEPTIQKNIIPFIRKIKELGFKVKLDSNGSQPDVLAEILREKLVDYIAMDIKSSPENYHKAIAMQFDMNKIKKSVTMIMESGVPYEFRTTVVPGIHLESDFLKIAKWIKGANMYYLQEYRDSVVIDEEFKIKNSGIVLSLSRIEKTMKPYLKKIAIRENN
jgi:pyruvate formate lyase activating enzyme